MNPELEALANLLKQRNVIDGKIAEIIGRPAERGHVGEYIAAALFDIGLATSATNKGCDGTFRSGKLSGRRVNVKWYGKREGFVDLVLTEAPDYYLVLTGDKGTAGSSRGKTRPWTIDAIYLFEGPALVSALSRRARPPKVGVATSVANEYWNAAEMWPQSRTTVLTLTADQREALQQFASGAPVAP